MVNKRDISITFRAKDATRRAIGAVKRNLASARESLDKFVFSVRGLVTGAIAGSLGKFFIDTARNAENLRASMETVTQSSAETDRVLKLLDKNAAALNSTVGDLGKAWIKLLNAGIEPSIERLEAFLNVAAANPGKNLDQFVEAVADALRGEFERLKEFGISASKQGEQVEFTFRNVATTVKNTSAEIGTYLEDLGRVQFAGGIERQANTIDGAFSNLDGALQRLGKTLNEGGGIGPNLREMVNDVTALVNLANDASKPAGLGELTAELDKLQRGVAGFGEDNSGRKSRIQVLQDQIREILLEADGPDGLRYKLQLVDEAMSGLELQAAELRNTISTNLLAPNINGSTEETLRPLLDLNEQLANINKVLGSLQIEREGLIDQLANGELAFDDETTGAARSTKALEGILRQRTSILKGYLTDSKAITAEMSNLSKSLESIGDAGKSVSLESASNQLAEIQGFLDAGNLAGATGALKEATAEVEKLIAARARFEELKQRAAAGNLTEAESKEIETLRRNYVGSELAIKGVIGELENFKKAVLDASTEKRLIDADAEITEAQKIKAEVEKLNPKLKLNPDLSLVKEAIGGANLAMQIRIIPIVDPAQGIVGARVEDGGGTAEVVLEREADKGGFRL